MEVAPRPPRAKAPRRKSPALAGLLQLIPGLGSGLVAAGWSGWPSPGLDRLGFLAFAWGVGYLYLGRPFRFLGSLILGSIVVAIVFASYFVAHLRFLFQLCSARPCQGVDVAAILAALAITLATLLPAAEAWQLAKDHNFRIDSEKRERLGRRES